MSLTSNFRALFSPAHVLPRTFSTLLLGTCAAFASAADAPDGIDEQHQRDTTVPVQISHANTSIGNAVAGGSSTSTLLSHWRLDGGSNDFSGNGHHGTLTGGANRTKGVVGQALELDGVDDFVNVPHQGALNSFPLSIAFWVKASATGVYSMVNKYAEGSFNGYQVFAKDGKLCAWYFRDADNHVWDSKDCTQSTAHVADGRWHHVVYTVDATGGRLYMDGNPVASQGWTGTPGPVTSTLALNLGRYPDTATPYLAGTLDDVRLYARALSPYEIAGYFDATALPAAPTPSLRADSALLSH